MTTITRKFLFIFNVRFNYFLSLSLSVFVLNNDFLFKMSECEMQILYVKIYNNE